MAEPKRQRDREGTEKAILSAARQVLAEEGFQGFGVNAIARQAGCDKQLVYRYFGGVDGLIDAIGADLANWWQDRLGASPEQAKPATYADLMDRLAIGLLDALRADPLVQKIIAWEVSDPSPQVARLTAARSKGMLQWIVAQRGDLVPPPGVDAPALNAFVVAGIQHLVLASSTAGQFTGAPLKTDADWDRMRSAVRSLIAAVYRAP